MAYNVTDAIFGAPKPDTDASSGWNIGQQGGQLSAQAGPAAFATGVIKAKQAEEARRAALAQEQQKARAAGVQRVITEGMMAPEGSAPRIAAEKISSALDAFPAFAQGIGFDPSKLTVGLNNSYKGSASFLNNKAKAMEDLITTVETGRYEKNRIADALSSAEKITGGLGGSLERVAMKLFDPNNPMLGEWQKIKTVLTDAQLMYTAKTKGAISDREMELFARAVANDDVASLPQIKVALADVVNKLNAYEQAKAKSFQVTYGDDVSQLLGIGKNGTQQTQPSSLEQLAASKGVKIKFK